MTMVRESEVIDAEPREVWRVIADPRNLPAWSGQVHAVHDAPNGELRAGDTYTVELRLMGLPARIRARVLEVQPERYSEVLLSGPLEATVRTYVRGIGSRRTRIEHEVDYRFRGGPLGRVAARAVGVLGAPLILRRGLRAQKTQVEGG